jgi:hypothetical protein
VQGIFIIHIQGIIHQLQREAFKNIPGFHEYKGRAVFCFVFISIFSNYSGNDTLIIQTKLSKLIVMTCIETQRNPGCEQP